MRILIAVASRYGSSREIAEALARKLRTGGHMVDVRKPTEAVDTASYDAALLGSAIYDGSWLTEATDFARRNYAVLAGKPVWVFSVGMLSSAQGWPLGALAKHEPREIAELRRALQPRDYHVFDGVVEPDRLSLTGRIIVKLLKGRFGDFRNWKEIDGWAVRIARELEASNSTPFATAAHIVSSDG